MDTNKTYGENLDGNYTRMLRAVLNKSWRKSWRQHSTKQQQYGHLPLITKTIQVRRTRHAGHCWRIKDELIGNVLLWTPSHERAEDDQLEPIHSSSVPILDIAWKTRRDRWTNKDVWQERVSEIRASNARWWWRWWWKFKIIAYTWPWY